MISPKQQAREAACELLSFAIEGFKMVGYVVISALVMLACDFTFLGCVAIYEKASGHQIPPLFHTAFTVITSALFFVFSMAMTAAHIKHLTSLIKGHQDQPELPFGEKECP